MRRIGLLSSLIAALSLLTSCLTTPSTSDLTTWRTTRSFEPPRFARTWDVYLQDGEAFARQWEARPDAGHRLPFRLERGRAEDGLAGDISAIKVADGWIIGFNAGEFGGGLWWFAPDGQRKYRLGDSNVRDFVKDGDQVYVLEGLAHLGLAWGGVRHLSRNAEGVWIAKELAAFAEVPLLVTPVDDGSVIVATDKRLLRIEAQGVLTTLVDQPQWPSTYLHTLCSMVVDRRGRIYIGMASAVMKVAPGDSKSAMYWLYPRPE